MRTRLAFVLVRVAFQAQSAAALRPDIRGCIPTERMPIIGLHVQPPEPMPVVRPPSTWRSPMPVDERIPCYLATTPSDYRAGMLARSFLYARPARIDASVCPPPALRSTTTPQ